MTNILVYNQEIKSFELNLIKKLKITDKNDRIRELNNLLIKKKSLDHLFLFKIIYYFEIFF